VWAVEAALVPDGALLARIRDAYGDGAMDRVRAWGELVLRLRGQDQEAQLHQVNAFFNRIPYRDDPQQWQVADYWATPLEFLVVNGGDCEDYALAKYFTLRALGVPDERLRVTYAQIWLPKRGRLEPHMVLIYYAHPGDDPLVLDNVLRDILPASRRTDLAPTLSFNASGLWAARQRGQNGRLGDTGSLSHWVSMLRRMN
jgi:predicted transglutaminase-like cysteine proteinase